MGTKLDLFEKHFSLKYLRIHDFIEQNKDGWRCVFLRHVPSFIKLNPLTKYLATATLVLFTVVWYQSSREARRVKCIVCFVFSRKMANSYHKQCDFCQLRVLICIFAPFFSMKQNSTSCFGGKVRQIFLPKYRTSRLSKHNQGPLIALRSRSKNLFSLM